MKDGESGGCPSLASHFFCRMIEDAQKPTGVDKLRSRLTRVHPIAIRVQSSSDSSVFQSGS